MLTKISHILGIKRLIIVILMSAGVIITPSASACTSAIIGAELNPSGRPILWKHRDTSTIDNKVEYVAPRKGEYGYTALFNAADKKLAEAWMGMNDAGFAVMNTASYNIKDDKVPERKMDKEGILMTRALKTCRTVDDFARLLDTYPRPMGVEANFGVIDASGNGAYFETNNHSYRRYDLKDATGHLLVRTNYSHSGRPDEGYGFVREANAVCVLQPYADEKNITPEVLTEVLSRTFYHDGRKHDSGMDRDQWVRDEDFIPRYKSTATVAIEGCIPMENPDRITPEFVADEYVMWTGIGYPPVSLIKAVRNMPGGVPDELRGKLPDGHSPAGDEAKALRDKVFRTGPGKDDRFIDMSQLFNNEGTGLVQKARCINRQTYISEGKARDKRHASRNETM